MSDIAPEHIQEINYHDCFDTSMAAVGSTNAIFIVLKPGVVYFHGGGWVLGSCETHDDMCAEMAADADCAVVLVDYRLAPEHRHPAQFEDAHTILAWMRKDGAKYGIDPARIVGAGDSAGGQMTVGLALSLRDRGVKQLKGQVLIYPVLGCDCAAERQNVTQGLLDDFFYRFELCFVARNEVLVRVAITCVAVDDRHLEVSLCRK
jgi:hypothetical protein